MKQQSIEILRNLSRQWISKRLPDVLATASTDGPQIFAEAERKL